jgi:poly-beta-1,6-N-acetyl-D-glucosamine synthase
MGLRHPEVGLRPAVRFAIALPLTLAYLAFAIWFSEPWRSDLEEAIGPVMAWLIPTMLAFVPSIVIGFLGFTLLLTRYRPLDLSPPRGPWPAGEWPAVTILIAAWNEEETIAATIERVGALSYDGALKVVLADNNSTDLTAALAQEAADRCGLDYRRVFEPEPGKFRALNRALEEVDTPLVVTLDADTLLQRQALSYIVSRLASRPQGQRVSACAGALVAENPTSNFLTRMQSWDYRLGINGVKGMQAAYNSALVAEGAFSAYRVEDVRDVGGWPDAIGEDIVLTWSLMNARGIVLYEPVALGFTTLPTRMNHFLRQRSRWARGMFEGIKVNPPRKQPRFLTKFVAGIDYLVPLLDIGYIFFWIPGVILFVFGYPLVFSWWSMLIIPVTLVIFGCMRRWQTRHVFRRLDIHPEHDVRGFVGYLLGYQALTSAAAIRGYAQYLRGAARRWR